MVIGRDARRQSRRPKVVESFPGQAEIALDLLGLADLAWHDAYGDLELPIEVVDDVLLVSKDLSDLIKAASLAVTDWRDLRVNADAVRGSRE